MKAYVYVGPYGESPSLVEVDGVNENGEHYNICRICKREIESYLYYEIGCPYCDYEREE